METFTEDHNQWTGRAVETRPRSMKPLMCSRLREHCRKEGVCCETVSPSNVRGTVCKVSLIRLPKQELNKDDIDRWASGRGDHEASTPHEKDRRAPEACWDGEAEQLLKRGPESRRRIREGLERRKGRRKWDNYIIASKIKKMMTVRIS